ncbi:unnamed protein product [Cuscuta campestris]|uniref:Uncharacterized protein n=1 Tax=Cuscuta campestris TaxID=132261 RepID=A0A484MN53_9ASTE|nr:unnamed protein product [Cuscuta campestris]
MIEGPLLITSAGSEEVSDAALPKWQDPLLDDILGKTEMPNSNISVPGLLVQMDISEFCSKAYNLDICCKGDFDEEFKLLEPLFSDHFESLFKESYCYLKEAMTISMVHDKLQKGISKNGKGKAFRMTRQLEKSIEAVDSVKIKGMDVWRRVDEVFEEFIGNDPWNDLFLLIDVVIPALPPVHQVSGEAISGLFENRFFLMVASRSSVSVSEGEKGGLMGLEGLLVGFLLVGIIMGWGLVKRIRGWVCSGVSGRLSCLGVFGCFLLEDSDCVVFRDLRNIPAKFLRFRQGVWEKGLLVFKGGAFSTVSGYALAGVGTDLLEIWVAEDGKWLGGDAVALGMGGLVTETKAAPFYSLPTGQAEEFQPLPRKILSPTAPAFVPIVYSYAALFTEEQGTVVTAEPEDDPFSNINGQSLILSLNAVEDHAKDRDGPILYTHSDGEEFVFIDTKLRPLQIDLSRCSKHPLHLRKELKGRRTYSPSQIVTRSKAKILEQGRKINPIGWVEEEDSLEPQESHEDEVIKFFKLCFPHKAEDPKPHSKPLTKTQKKKMKKKKKQSQFSDYGLEEEIEYAY